MIKCLKLKFGRGPGAPAESIDATPVTVFVGPNNAGKSRVLQELNRFCTTGYRSETDVIVDELEFEGLSQETAAQRIAALTLRPRPAESISRGNIIVGKRDSRNQVESIGDLLEPPHSSFQVLFRDDYRRGEVRRTLHGAFGLYFVIDPSNEKSKGASPFPHPPTPPAASSPASASCAWCCAWPASAAIAPGASPIPRRTSLSTAKRSGAWSSRALSASLHQAARRERSRFRSPRWN
jgi:hypothetical protein